MADAYLKVKDNNGTLSLIREEADGSFTDLKSAIGYESKIIPMAYIATNGTVSAASSSSPWNLYCVKVRGKDIISSIELGSVSQSIVYGLFADEPSIGSTTYNNSRTSSGVLSLESVFIPSICTWIAIRYNPTDNPKVVLSSVIDLNKAIKNLGGTPAGTDLNNTSSNSVIYGSSNTITDNYPAQIGNVGYFETFDVDANNKMQIGYDARGSGLVVRAKASGTWSTWNKIITEQDKPIKNLGGASFNDLNNAPDNSLVYGSSNTITSHYPSGISTVGYFETITLNSGHKLQIAYGGRGEGVLVRAEVGGTWSEWNDFLTQKTGVSKQEAYATSCVSLFQTIGCCGDSFTAGYLYNKTDSPFYDPDYVPNGEYPAVSYGKVMGRLYGIDVTLFAKGGLTSTAWRTDSAGLPALNAATAKQLYIICLGLNDRTQEVPIGVEADIDTEPQTPTYLGNMGAIIRAIQSHAPLCKIILMKSPWVYNAGGSTANTYYNYSSSAIELLSSHLSIPYLETLDDPFFCSDAYVNGLKGLHPTAPLYAGMGKRIGELVGKCVIDNPSYFYNFYIPN